MTDPAPPPSGFRHKRVAAANLDIHVVEGGSGPLVLLLAGFPQTWYAWRRVMPLLAGSYRVVAADLPGQGESEAPARGYDTRTSAGRIAALIAALDGGPGAILVGHDIGAWIAYPFAALHADLVRGVAIIDGNIPGIALPDTVALGPEGWRSWHFAFNALADLPEALLAGRERVLIEWFFRNKSADPTTTCAPADLDEYARAYAVPGALSGTLGYYRAVDESRAQNRKFAAAPIHLPLLALGGAQGAAPDLFERMQPLGTDVRGGRIDGCGHYVPEEQPRALADALSAFCASVSNGGRL